MNRFPFLKLQLSILFFFISTSLIAQVTHTFPSSGTFIVPAGATKINVEAWGSGGSGGAAIATSALSIITGRSGGGGGGGAYAKSQITVAANQNLSVVVGGTTLGGTSNGTTGGNSTITGFATSILARGGEGGVANTGGAAAGGKGGTAIGGITATAGGDGTAGSAGLLGILFWSGAGGKGANPGGGLGGEAISSLILGNSDGNSGLPLSGGGGGALSTLLEVKKGGNGAAGQVILTYSSPNYSLTGISAANNCVSAQTSLVTLTSTSAGLPIGTYTVSYTRGNPAGSATASMTVTQAGSGTFTASGLNIAGATTITVNALSSGSMTLNATTTTTVAYSKTITANNIANVTMAPQTVGGTITGSKTICSGFTSDALLLTDQIGTVLSWQSNNGPFSSWIDIPNTSGITSYTSDPLMDTTSFRAVVQSGNCSVVNSAEVLITVLPLPSITLGTVASVCSSPSVQNLVINYTTPTESPTTYGIVWSPTPPNNFAVVTDVALGGSSITIPVPAGTTAGTYTGTLKVKNNNNCVSSAGISFSIVVKALPATPAWGAVTQSTCVSPTGSVVLSGLTPSTPWTITQTGTFFNSYPGSGSTYQVSNLAPGTYNFEVRYGTECNSLPTAAITIDNPVTNTWSGTAWSKGSQPIITDAIVFSGNYSTTGNLSGCSCVVNSGVLVTVNSNHTLTIANSVSNNGGTVIFENNSSLVQTSNAVNTGDIFYKRITKPVRRYDQTFWASPVTRSPIFTLHDLSSGTLSDKYYKYDPVADDWVVINNGTEEMRKGIGYNIRAPQSHDINTPTVFNAEFTGVPNNGPVSVPLGGLDKWALIGNPYPSAIYADQFIVDNQTNLYGTLYFWTHNSLPNNNNPGDYQYNYNADDYAIYNLTGNLNIGEMTGTGAPTPGNQSAPLGYIAAGQAFFVISKTNTSAVFTNSMRVSGFNSQFYKTNGSEVTVEKHRVWINMTNTQGAFKQLLIGYVTGATNSWDNNYDGLSLDGSRYIDFYSINDSKKLVIQGRAVPFDDSDAVPLGYRSALAGSFTIAIDHSDGELSKRAIYLEDKVTGLVQDLTLKDYTFKTAIGIFNDRFILTYGKTLGIEDLENVKNNVLVSVKDKIIRLTSNSSNENLSEVTIFDVSGKALYNKKKIGSNELEIVNLKSGDQVLIVKTTLENGNTTSTKIVF